MDDPAAESISDFCELDRITDVTVQERCRRRGVSRIEILP